MFCFSFELFKLIYSADVKNKN